MARTSCLNFPAHITGAEDVAAPRLDHPLNGTFGENLISGDRARDLGTLADLERVAGHIAFHNTIDSEITGAIDIADDRQR
jgi:hypothetical protein